MVSEKGRKGGAVAQLVEQRTENPCVGGSIPPHTTYGNLKLFWGFLFDTYSQLEFQRSHLL
jgi:hypothetical protein